MRAHGEAILDDDCRLAVLFNNAGIRLPGEGKRRTGGGGHEFTFSVNGLRHASLTRILPQIIPPSPAARIVIVLSGRADRD